MEITLSVTNIPTEVVYWVIGILLLAEKLSMNRPGFARLKNK